MTVTAPDKVAADTAVARHATKDPQPHSGPVSRMLAKVNKWSMEYADYHYSHCDWRRIAI